VINKIPSVGVGACLVGSKVRYNGESKRKNRHIEHLGEHVQLQAFCPEVAIGMGVPRQTVRLVGDIGSVRLTDSATQTADYTQPMQAYAAEVMEKHPDMTGYILVKGSPSCGFDRVKRYNDKGNPVLSDSVGIFAAELRRLDPLLPVEEDGRLCDAGLRENFVNRVFAYQEWKAFRAGDVDHHGLIQYWSRYKYLVMSHHVPTYKAIGRLLSGSTVLPIQETATRFITLLMEGLGHMATRNTHSNVLQHIQGYLKRDLDSADKGEMNSLITQYRHGQIPLVVPLTLLHHHFRLHKSDYIDRQVYMQPYPAQLALRNLI
jgi:uncharacterized protein YbgA (DUF1722 family)/uncharacterized protein YbbK (DUF523 family)